MEVKGEGRIQLNCRFNNNMEREEKDGVMVNEYRTGIHKKYNI